MGRSPAVAGLRSVWFAAWRLLERLLYRFDRAPRLIDAIYIAIVVAIVAVVVFDPLQAAYGPPALDQGSDAANYWRAWHVALYHGSRLMYGTEVYLYSPAFAQIIYPLTLLEWPAFRQLWLYATLFSMAWMIVPAPNRHRLVLIPIAGVSALVGGIEWLIGLVTILGRRFPALWAIPLLTKVTPGVGLLWFVARREWRSLAVALGTTLAVAGVSFVIAPALWADWADVLYRNLTVPHYEGIVGYLPLRLALAAAVVWLGARRDQPLAIGAAVILATPDINLTTAGLACVLPRLLRESGAPGYAARPGWPLRLPIGN
jgi:hypothetical protein